MRRMQSNLKVQYIANVVFSGNKEPGLGEANLALPEEKKNNMLN